MNPFQMWYEALENRHLSNLTFQEVRRGVQALSTIYVENRNRIDSGAVLNGAGKRAAFALFYAPLHFLLVREIVRSLSAARRKPNTILDLGCGTGSAGAAWALEYEARPRIIGVDRHAWALEEARWTYRALSLQAITKSVDIRKLQIPSDTAVIAAFTINELDDESRTRWLDAFLKAAAGGAPILIIEPIARRVAHWWDEWAGRFKSRNGRDDQWRFKMDLPEKLKLMDKAAGLDHREITGRSLWLPGYDD